MVAFGDTKGNEIKKRLCIEFSNGIDNVSLLKRTRQADFFVSVYIM